MNDVLEQAPFRDEKVAGHADAAANRTHETRDANVRLLAICAALFIALGIGLHLAIGWQFRHFVRTPTTPAEPPSPFALQAQTPPPPRMQIDPAEAYRQFNAAQRQELNSPVGPDANDGHCPYFH